MRLALFAGPTRGNHQRMTTLLLGLMYGQFQFEYGYCMLGQKEVLQPAGKDSPLELLLPQVLVSAVGVAVAHWFLLLARLFERSPPLDVV